MADTTATSVSNSAIAIMQKAFHIAAMDNIVMDQFASYKFAEQAKTIDFVKFSKMAKIAANSDKLTDGTEATAVAVTDNKVTFTPAEFGNVSTITSLATLQTGGKVDLAVPKLVGMNMAESMNALAMDSLKVSTDTDITDIFCDATATETNAAAADILAADVLDYDNLQAAHNQLMSANIAPFEGGYYTLLVHPHVAGDLVKTSEWAEHNKYTSQERLFKNEVGVLGGFRVISSTGVPFVTNGGNGNVDLYYSYALGQNAYGKAVSLEPEIRVTGPFDNLGREYNVGWYGVFQYDVVDGNALCRLHSSSSYGAN
ncbi:MAG: hypothetical protein Unbinned4311contig1001_20 [Prokaryotic dsDNA virus sp.]|nr:MAG: hypothetical protein Unbinned4311contig1001_20 [Prokaryotic dsDNA virus sp.]|tara:strand:+ start:2376 stop:3317 length:942 start_codon:yes stop_codon:yes gene_type:complete